MDKQINGKPMIQMFKAKFEEDKQNPFKLTDKEERLLANLLNSIEDDEKSLNYFFNMCLDGSLLNHLRNTQTEVQVSIPLKNTKLLNKAQFNRNNHN